jgi:hypothetical protein
MKDLVYRGSMKHKARPARGRKGSLCPEWTHTTPTTGLANDESNHPWEQSIATEMLQDSELDPQGSSRRYATRRGVAFAAHDTRDGSWHGFPIPWNDVPSELKDQWVSQSLVSPRDLRKYSDKLKSDTSWALETDED